MALQRNLSYGCGWRGYGEGEDWRKVILGLILLIVVFAIISVIGQFLMRLIIGTS